MDSWLPIVVVIAIVAIGTAWWGWSWLRAERVASDWAVRQGYQVVHIRRHWLRAGPFVLPMRTGQVVLRMELLPPNGQARVCWLCLGSYWLGMLSDRIDAKWDDGELLTSAST